MLCFNLNWVLRFFTEKKVFLVIRQEHIKLAAVSTSDGTSLNEVGIKCLDKSLNKYHTE